MDESQTQFFSHHGSVACRWVSADVDNDVVSLATAARLQGGAAGGRLLATPVSQTRRASGSLRLA
jgi:hypothetical protein